MAVENVKEKQEAKQDDANASAREALSGEALSSKAGAAAGSVADALSKNSSNVQEHLPGLSLGNSGERHGIVTTYDADGNATSDCNGPIPRKGDRTHMGLEKQQGQLGGMGKSEGKLGDIEKKLEQTGGLGKQQGQLGGLDKSEGKLGDIEKKLEQFGSLDKQEGQLGGLDKSEGKLGDIEKKLEQFGGLDKQLGKIGGLDKHEGSLGGLEKKLNNDELKIIHKDGVEKLSTGDYVIKKGDVHGYVSKDGVSDQIVVNADGTYKIDGNISKSTTKDGVTTVEFKDGAVVAFDDGGIKSVTRDGHTVDIKEVNVMEAFPPPMLKPYFEKPGLGHINPRLER